MRKVSDGMTSIQPLTFGTLLKRHRRAVGLTQEALAARANFSTTYISMLERGERVPQTATVELLAEALALTPAERVTLQTTVQGQPRMPSTMSRSRGVLSPIVGRVLELTLLEHHLAGEGPPVLLLAGEPGIGKSRLLLEAVQMAQAGGFCVLEGGCCMGYPYRLPTINSATQSGGSGSFGVKRERNGLVIYDRIVWNPPDSCVRNSAF